MPLPNMSGDGTSSDLSRTGTDTASEASSSSTRTDHARTDLRAARAHTRAPRDARRARAVDETDAQARHPVDARMATPKTRETWHPDVSHRDRSRSRNRADRGSANHSECDSHQPKQPPNFLPSNQPVEDVASRAARRRVDELDVCIHRYTGATSDRLLVVQTKESWFYTRWFYSVEADDEVVVAEVISRRRPSVGHRPAEQRVSLTGPQPRASCAPSWSASCWGR